MSFIEFSRIIFEDSYPSGSGKGYCKDYECYYCEYWFNINL